MVGYRSNNPALPRFALRSSCRRGFANGQMLAALGIALLLGLIMLAETGQLGYRIAGSLVGTEAPGKADSKNAKDSKKKKKGKNAAAPSAPPLFPGPESPLAAAIPRIEQRRATLWRAERWRDARARRGLAHMDEAAAAALLLKMPDPDAAGLLRGLDEFALGRILEATPPDKGAAWLRLLTAEKPRPPLAPELMPAAAVTGSEAAFDELLRQYGYGPEGSLLDPSSGGAAANPVTSTDAAPPASAGDTAGSGAAAANPGAGQAPPAALPPGTTTT